MSKVNPFAIKIVLVTEDGEVYGPFDNHKEANAFGNESIYVGFTLEFLNPTTMVVTDRG